MSWMTENLLWNRQTYLILFSTPVLPQPVLAAAQEDFSSHLSVSSILAKDFHLNFSFHSISPAYIESLLGKIKCNKSCGPDNITPKILKLSTPALAVPLTNLLNHCIATSRWPNEWKLSNVTPVFKKGDALLVSNYRPISILSAIPKIMEKVMFDQLYDAFQPVFSPNMSGFLRGHSCCTALVKMIDDFRWALDSKMSTCSVAIDLTKAFDSICHNLLLAKLHAYGVSQGAMKFLQSYLSNRQQRVKVNGVLSDWSPVLCGVPQGSLLGPLLFNIFINDLNFVTRIASLRLYADDTTTYTSAANTTALELSFNQDLQKLSTWFSSNYLTVNHSKTQAMILGNFNYQPVLSIGNSIIEIESFLEILGVHIDNKLSFKAYVSAILKKVYAKIGALRRLKRLVPPDIALILYKCYILPHLEYCSPLLLGINKTLANKLEAANYYALKVLLNVGNDVDYNSILSIAGMNSLEFRRYEQSLSLLYKCIKGNGPSYISDFFKFRVSHYNLRGGGCNLVQPSYNNQYFHNSFTYKITHLWNKLPTYIKQSPNLNAFHKNLESINLLNLRTSCLCNYCQS